MQAKLLRKTICLLGMGLFLALPIPAAQETPSVLSRVQTVDDPELAELIRVAVENLADPQETEAVLKTVGSVTQSYAQIRLLDRQIEQLAERIKTTAGIEELRHELLLAQAELESQRIVELARLRQAMGVIPRHALGRKPVQQLKTWLKLDAINDEVIYVLEAERPFSVKDRGMKYSPAGMMSKQQTLDYVQGRLKQKAGLPIRIDIPRTVAGIELADALREELVALVKKTGLEMEAEVHLDAATPRWARTWEEIPIEVGQIMIRGVDPNTIATHVERLLADPWRIPVTFSIRHDGVSGKLAEQVGKTVEDVARRLGVAEFVQVTYNTVNTKAQYIGQWQAVQRDWTITIEGNYRCHWVEGGGEAEQGRWRLTSEGVALEDVEGYIDSDGRLVMRGDDEAVVFEKVK